MHLHRFTAWKTINTGKLRRHADDGGGVYGFFVTQERECRVCGKVNLRVVRTKAGLV